VEGARGPPYPSSALFGIVRRPAIDFLVSAERGLLLAPLPAVVATALVFFNQRGCGLARRGAGGTLPTAAACRHTAHSFVVANMGTRQRYMGEWSGIVEGGTECWGAGAGTEVGCVLARRGVGGGGC